MGSIWETHRPKTRAEKVIHWTGITLFALLVASGAGILIFVHWHDGASGLTEPEQSLSGLFSLAGSKDHPAWHGAPTRCLDGTERGFQGIAFEFAAGAVTEIRLDTSRTDTVEVRFAEPARPAILAREPDCERIEGTIRRSNYVLNGRHMFSLVENLRVDCPEQGVRGHATFNGCLPMTAADLQR